MIADILERLEQAASAYPADVFLPLTESERSANRFVIQRASAAMGRHLSPLLTEAAAEIGRLRGELAVANECLGEERAANVLRTPAPAMPNGVEYDRELIARMLGDYVHLPPGSGRVFVKDDVEAQARLLRAADNRDAAGVECRATDHDWRGDGLCETCGLRVGYTPAAVPAGEAVADDWQHESMRFLAYKLRQMSAVGFDADTCADAASWLEKFSRTPQPADGEATFHLRSYGTVSAAELAKYTAPARVAYSDEPTAREAAARELLALGWRWEGNRWQRPPAPVQAAPQEGAPGFTFGVGGIAVSTGKYEGAPAVFLRDVPKRGEVGNPVEGADLKAVMVFPTVEQAQRVADALVNAAHPSACELGAVRDATQKARNIADGASACNAQGPQHQAGMRRACNIIEAALQHRGDSQEVGRG